MIACVRSVLRVVKMVADSFVGLTVVLTGAMGLATAGWFASRVALIKVPAAGSASDNVRSAARKGGAQGW